MEYGVKMENMLDYIVYECQLYSGMFTGRLQTSSLIRSQSRNENVSLNKKMNDMTFVLQISDNYFGR